MGTHSAPSGAAEHTRLRELHEEEERIKLKMLQADAGLVSSHDILITAERMDWMYHNPAQAKKEAEREDEEFLLGKSINSIDEREEMRKRLGVGTTAPGSLFLSSVTHQNEDTLRKLREDPLFIIRQAEHQQHKMELAREKMLGKIRNGKKSKEKNRTKKSSIKHEESNRTMRVLSPKRAATRKGIRGNVDHDDHRHHSSSVRRYITYETRNQSINRNPHSERDYASRVARSDAPSAHRIRSSHGTTSKRARRRSVSSSRSQTKEIIYIDRQSSDNNLMQPNDKQNFSVQSHNGWSQNSYQDSYDSGSSISRSRALERNRIYDRSDSYPGDFYGSKCQARSMKDSKQRRSLSPDYQDSICQSRETSGQEYVGERGEHDFDSPARRENRDVPTLRKRWRNSPSSKSHLSQRISPAERYTRSPREKQSSAVYQHQSDSFYPKKSSASNGEPIEAELIIPKGPVLPREWKDKLDTTATTKLAMGMTSPGSSASGQESNSESLDSDLGPPQKMSQLVEKRRQERNEIPLANNRRNYQDIVDRQHQPSIVSPVAPTKSIENACKNERSDKAKQKDEKEDVFASCRRALQVEDKLQSRLKEMQEDGRCHEREKNQRLDHLEKMERLKEKLEEQKRAQTMETQFVREFKKDAYMSDQQTLQERMKRYAARRKKRIVEDELLDTHE